MTLILLVVAATRQAYMPCEIKQSDLALHIHDADIWQKS